MIDLLSPLYFRGQSLDKKGKVTCLIERASVDSNQGKNIVTVFFFVGMRERIGKREGESRKERERERVGKREINSVSNSIVYIIRAFLLAHRSKVSFFSLSKKYQSIKKFISAWSSLLLYGNLYCEKLQVYLHCIIMVDR